MAEDPKPVSIKGMLDLAPTDAIAFLDSKGYATSVDWTDVFQDEHIASFTVAKVAKVDLLRTIHVSLLDAMANGTPFEAWQAGLQPELERAGWWGQVQDEDLTGTTDLVRVGPRRLRTIYDTNLRMARATALWQRIQASKEDLPYLRYSAVLDRRTRPQHRAWHGTLLPVDHPFWLTHFPPNGWNCRCTVVQLTEGMAAARGGVTPVPADGPPLAFRRRGSTRSEMVPQGIDPGFAYNPGVARRTAIAEKVAASLVEAQRQGVPGVTSADTLRELLSEAPAGRVTDAVLARIAQLVQAAELGELAALLVELLA